MTPSPYSISLLNRIKKKNKRRPVTVDSLMEGRGWRATSKIVEAIKELREANMVTCVSILDHGKFATEIAGFEGWKEHGKVPGKLRVEGPAGAETEGWDSSVSKPKRKYTKRTVKRSLV